MKLWTHHPEIFRLDDPSQRVDHTLGDYWKDEWYRNALPRLHILVGTNQFVWCCTKKEDVFHPPKEPSDTIRWELEIPPSHATWTLNAAKWNQILNGADDWTDLIVKTNSALEIQVLVKLPLSSACKVTNLGRVPGRELPPDVHGMIRTNPAWREYRLKHKLPLA